MTYPHQDGYYIIGMVEKGSGSGIIDFKECNFSQGDVFLIQPGQVHRFIGSNDVEGWILFTDSSFVGDAEKNIFDNFLLFASSVKVGIQRMNELKQIASILADRIGRASDKQSKTTARRLTETFVSIVAETVQETGLQHIKSSRRQIEIVLAFRHLLTEHLAVNRSPSYYASRLNISPAYLNEVVKKVTGMNASSYIRNETVLQAKRLLVHTTLAVKEISDRLGIYTNGWCKPQRIQRKKPRIVQVAPRFVYHLFAPPHLILQQKGNKDEKNNNRVRRDGSTSLRGMLGMCG